MTIMIRRQKKAFTTTIKTSLKHTKTGLQTVIRKTVIHIFSQPQLTRYLCFIFAPWRVIAPCLLTNKRRAAFYKLSFFARLRRCAPGLSQSQSKKAFFHSEYWIIFEWLVSYACDSYKSKANGKMKLILLILIWPKTLTKR